MGWVQWVGLGEAYSGEEPDGARQAVLLLGFSVGFWGSPFFFMSGACAWVGISG